ncbi:PiggyBac transposable element-derived protein 4 [Anthophora quadrimaculata]
MTKAYKPSENLTIDEQLFRYKGRTKFTQYMPSKPAKYGIKIWWISVSENYYPLSGQIYTGKSTLGREINQGEQVVKNLAGAYKGSGRNITTDNFFTTVPLAKFLLSWRLTILGTIRKNKKYIPREMAPSKSREEYSSLFAYHENITLCSYVPKKEKAVILLSTIHTGNVFSGSKRKPEIVEFYNRTKSGVDTMDQLKTRKSCQKCTQPVCDKHANTITICKSCPANI